MKIGFIGLGIMGSRMAANLQAGDVDLIVHNRTREKAEKLLEDGAVWADRPQDVAVADIVFTMLAHPQAVVETAVTPNGFLSHLRPGTLWVDCSTVNPSFSREMAAAARDHGVRFLEAPVAGTKPQAQNAALIFFVGGAEENVETVRPYMEMMGQRIIHVGDHGMATSMKVVINMLLATAMATFAEGMALGQALGLPSETLFDTLIGGPVVAPFLASKRQMMETGDYDTQFPLQWMQKDMHMAALAAYDAGVALPIANVTKEIYRQAMQSGLATYDFSAIHTYMTMMNTENWTNV